MQIILVAHVSQLPDCNICLICKFFILFNKLLVATFHVKKKDALQLGFNISCAGIQPLPTSHRCWTSRIYNNFFCQKLWLCCSFQQFFLFSLQGDSLSVITTACVVNLPAIWFNFKNADGILLGLLSLKYMLIEIKNTKVQDIVCSNSSRK